MKKQSFLDSFERFANSYQYWLIGGGLLIGALLRLIKLGTWSIWFDESFTSSVVRADIPTGVAITAKDVHPPLYYVLLKGWGAIFGYSDVALRMFSVVCSLIAALLIYGLLKRLFQKHYLALGGFLVVLFGPFGVRYAQEARMYMLATIFIVAATWAFYNLMEKPRPARRDKFIYALMVAASLYTHYFTFPIVLAHLVYAYIFHYRGLRPRWLSIKQLIKERKAWAGGLLMAGLLYLPWLPIAAYQFSTVASGFWIGRVTALDPFYTFFFYLFNTSSDRIEFEYDKNAAMLAVVVSAAFLMALTAVIIGILREARSQQRRAFSLLLLTSVVPMAVIFVLSLNPFQSYYIHRYFIYFGMLWYGVLGVILLYRFPKLLAWLRWPLIATVSVSFIIGLANVYRLGNFNYNTWQIYGSKPLMAYVNQHYQPGDVVLTNDIFTFYDAMHYNETEMKIYADDTKEGTAHTPYLRQFPELVIEEPSDLTATRVWFLTLADDQPQAAANWSIEGEPLRSEHAKLTLYTVQR